MRRRIALLFAALVAPSMTLAQATPSMPVDAAAVSAFWTTLGDTTLARVIGEALRQSPDVRTADARLRAARARRTQSALELAPSARTVGGFTRSRASTAQLQGAPRAERELWDAGVEASWEIDVFGRLQPVVAARAALVGAAREDVRGAQVALAGEIARTYFELQGTRRRLGVAARNAENQRRTLQLTVDRLAAGRGTAFDRERATAQLASTLAAIPTLEARVAEASLRLDALAGVTPRPTSLADEIAPVDDAIVALPAAPSRDAALEAVRLRPDVRAAERALAAQGALARAARADYLPRLSVAASVGVAASPDESFGRGGTTRYAVGPVVSWPAFDIGRVHARVEQARAASAEARADYDRVVLAAQAETESARIALDRSRARLALLQDAAQASERGAELARLRFTGGAAGFLEVLDAERTMLEAQDRLAQGESDAAAAFAALYRALGGAWPPIR